MKAIGSLDSRSRVSSRSVAPITPIAHYWFSIGEAASLLKRTEHEVFSFAVDGPLEAAIVGGEFRISESSLKQFMARGLHVEHR